MAYALDEPIDPYAPYDPYADQPLADPYQPTPEPSWTPPPPQPYEPYQPPTADAPPKDIPVDYAPNPEPQPAPYTPPPVQQLPDGSGGAIPIPPPELAPPGTVPAPEPVAPPPLYYPKIISEPLAPAPTEPQPIEGPGWSPPPPTMLPTVPDYTPPPPEPTAPTMPTAPTLEPPPQPPLYDPHIITETVPQWTPPVPDVSNPWIPPPETPPRDIPELPPGTEQLPVIPQTPPPPPPPAETGPPPPPPAEETPPAPPPEETVPQQPTTQPGIDPNTGLPVSTTPGAPATYQPPPLGDVFSGDENLINAQILPQVDPRVTQQQSAGDAGLQAQDVAPDIPVPGADPRLLKFQGLTDDLLQKLTNAPDRLGLAKQYYDTFSKETEGDYDRSLQEATNLGAAHGRLGSGILTNTYGDLAERRLRDKEAAKERLLNAATEGSIADRQQMFENLAGAERNAFGEAGANTEALRQERDARRQLVSAHYTQADKALADAAKAREEQRGERTYQGGLAEQALIRRIMQQAAESGLDSQAFQQALQLFGAGNTNDPTGALGDAAAAAGGEASTSTADIAALLRLLAQRRNQDTGAAT